MLLFCSTPTTPVLTPYLPVSMLARVGVQTGLAHALVKRTPSFAKRSRVGKLGFCAPRE